jgi:NAD(P)H-dependent flavin oxidoreductase YrpB (nitropropane dioxygenase family)
MNDALRTRLCEEYGCEVPIVAFAHTKDVVAAVTNAGGIGVLGGAGGERRRSQITPPYTAEQFRADIRWIKDRVGGRPFGCDLVLPASIVEGNREDLEAMIPQEHRDFVDRLHSENSIPYPKRMVDESLPDFEALTNSRAKLEVLFEEHVPIFASGLGSPAFILERAHAEGVKVWGLIGRPRQAAREIEAGVDLIIAQGYDSGGHSGSIGTFSLVPQIVELAQATQTPVLAAGGVCTGKHLAAALAMGAAGVWTGTIWLATHESETEMFLKHRLIEAQLEDVVQSRATSGKPIRQLKSRWSDVWSQPDAPQPLQMPLQGMLVRGIQTGIREGQLQDWMTTPAGQSVAGVRELKPAAEVLYDIVEEAQEMLERLAGISDTD